MRQLERYPVEGPNGLWQIYRTVSPWKGVKNFIFIQLAHEYLIKVYRLGQVVIGSNVMIGANCTVLPGVTIGDGAVVAAGSVVHKDVLPGQMVGGNPLRIIREAPASRE